MAAKDSGDSRLDGDEAQTCSGRRKGGWITFPFVAGSTMGISVAMSGVLSNLIVYLVQQLNVKSIDAAQISNIINGCTSISPLLGAIISDSFFGYYTVVVVSNFACVLGMLLFTLTATITSLRPPSCTSGTNACQTASTGQYAVLYMATALMSIGTGGTRFNIATMGANQFDEARHQDIFFNWYFVVLYVASIVGATGIVYVQDNVSWGWGFGLCTIANAIGLVILVSGTRYYRRPRPEGSPFMDLARVVVAAIRKRKMMVSAEAMDYCYGRGGEAGKLPSQGPTQSCRFLNRAALKAQGDTPLDSSIPNPWRLCTVEQVEDLKTIVRILPLWATSIFLSISIGIQASLTVLQALTMDRTLGRHHFSIPAGSLYVAALATVALSLSLLDRAVYPVWRKLTSHTPTPLQRIGLGHLMNTIAMSASALVERRRLRVLRSDHIVNNPGYIVPMSVLWLIPPLIIVGLGEAFHFPGQVVLYYQEFPKALRSTATGMIALLIALGFYLSTAVIDLVRRVTNWLPDNINASRLDNMYWMLAVIGVLNFGCYVLCARLYKYQSIAEKGSDKDSGSVG